jgi:hypothetical protein
MPNHAGGAVGEISNIAVLDEDALAVADVGDARGEVLRGGEGSGEDAEQYGDAQPQEEISFVSVDRRDESHMIPLVLEVRQHRRERCRRVEKCPWGDDIVKRGRDKEQAAS